MCVAVIPVEENGVTVNRRMFVNGGALAFCTLKHVWLYSDRAFTECQAVHGVRCHRIVGVFPACRKRYGK